MLLQQLLLHIHSSDEASNNARWTVDDGLEMTGLKPVPVYAAPYTRARRWTEHVQHFLYRHRETV